MAPLNDLYSKQKLFRGISFACAFMLFVCVAGCGGVAGGLTSVTSPSPTPNLTAADVTALLQAAAQAADPNTMVIAVVDRAGNILAVYRKPAAPALSTGNFGVQVDTNELAVSLARTAAFFSNDQAPLSSRTVRFISGIHFPPGISGAPNAALYGIENTNRGCTLSTNFIAGKTVPPARSIGGATTGLGITTGKADLNDSDPNAVNPGGVPLFRNGSVVGGIGVAGVAGDVAEFAAYAAATSNGFGPAPAAPGVVVIDGVALPFVNQTTRPAGIGAGSFNATFFVLGPAASPGSPPEGMLVAPVAGLIGGLSASDVTQIINDAITIANKTRAVIRLPIGSSARMAIAVADLDGTIIGLYRMADGTVFSIDVAASKARNMAYFNSGARTAADLTGVPMGTAITNRTIGFGAQPLYPPGINVTAAGPFFNLYQRDVANPCTQGFQVTVPTGKNQSGIVFFPGSVPLYRNGMLVGGLGISGDGVDQDDYVAAGGAASFEAPTAIRADQVMVRGVRLPYLKFPQNPTN
jgi:uncharacterized protein GlcG (DUF336 family)